MGWRITTSGKPVWQPGKTVLHAGVTTIEDQGRTRVIVGVEYTVTRDDGTSRVWPASLVFDFGAHQAHLQGELPDEEQSEAMLATLADIGEAVGRTLGYAGGAGFSIN
jgi:hypothetical protein